jgi:hypothetical protein
MPIFRRRRLPRRPLLRQMVLPGRRAGVPRAALHQLRRANRLMSEGAYAGAASIFEELADAAQGQGIWRTPQLNIQAGVGWLMAGEITVGMNRILKGLSLMPEMGQAARLPRVAARIERSLQDMGLEAQAAALDRQVQPLLAGEEVPRLATEPEKSTRTVLPEKCPHCGGNVLPSEVEWVDKQSAICDYCGSLIHGST